MDLSTYSCTTEGHICDQTRITVQSPGDSWNPGAYILALLVNGVSQQCTLQVSNPPVGVQGVCTADTTNLSLQPVCSQPPIVCNDGVCEGTVSSANCLAGQFTMQLAIGPYHGTDAQPPYAQPLSLNLSLQGIELLSETVAPSPVTQEFSGGECGSCTNASETLSISGGGASGSDAG